MKVTLNWIKEFLDLNDEILCPKEIAELLTMSGTEVKKIDDVKNKFKNIVVGQIISISSHPDADKLSVCSVESGRGVLNIVCGAKNFHLKDKVALALEGSKTAQGIVIKKSRLRGVVSEGMMCSEYELGLSDESEGIMILSQDSKVGEDFADAAGYNDVVFEIEVTPNRPDCLSISGIAREVSVLKNIAFKPSNYNTEGEINTGSQLIIDIDDYDLCPRYSAKIFSNINSPESPEWLKRRLIMCDYRPIDLIVDLTNYVMHELGQPLHAFDLDLLYSKKIIIRSARQGEKIKTIDGNIRELKPGMLVIADEKKPVAIAGIMGGKDTEINPATKNFLLESANFFGPSIMRTSKALGLRSEASNRFEKKIDPMLTIPAIKRFEDLLAAISKSNFQKGIYDNYRKTGRSKKISLRMDKVASILGKDLDKKESERILSGLGIEINSNAPDINVLEAITPSSRFEDLEREIDLIEEIARIHGFDNFKSLPPRGSMRKGGYTKSQKFTRDLRQSLANNGFYEVINYSFTGEEWIKKLKLDQEEIFKDSVKIMNPINEEFLYLRTTPLPLMIKNTVNNINRGIKDVSIFEITNVYLNQMDKNGLPSEKSVLGVMASGRVYKKSWNVLQQECDFYYLKGILEYLLENFTPGFPFEINEREFKFFHPAISSQVIMNGSAIGIIGKIHPAITDELDILQDIYYMELNLDGLMENAARLKPFKPIAAFPSIEIDIAIVVDEKIKHSDIVAQIKKSGTAILKEINLFDIYRGKQIEDGKKSMAYSLAFQDDTRTLKDVEVDIIIKRVLEDLWRCFGAKIRV